MAYWKPLTIEGKAIDLAHLEPFSFSLEFANKTRVATIAIEFSNHCFSEKYDPEKHSTVLLLESSKVDQRAFNAVRYALSRKLPEIIAQLGGKRIVQARNGTLIKVSLEGGVDYAVFFNLRKQSATICQLYVISAYPLEKSRKNMIVATGEIQFNVAVGLVMQDKKPKFPPRIQRQIT